MSQKSKKWVEAHTISYRETDTYIVLTWGGCDTANELFTFILDFLGPLSMGNNVYMDTRSMEENAVDRSYVLSTAQALDEPVWKAYHLREFSMASVNEGILDTFMLEIYIFEEGVTWPDFARSKSINAQKHFSNGTLIATMGLTHEGTEVNVRIQIDHKDILTSALEKLLEKGYVLKKSRWLF